MKHQLNDTDRGKRKDSEGNLSRTHFSTTKSTWIAVGATLDLRGEKPTANRLSYGTANW
jgi:hypothetical protein